MLVSGQAIEIIDSLAEKPCYVREISKRLGFSTRTTVKWLRKFRAMGITESFKHVEGKGKPQDYHHLTSLGKKLYDVLELSKFMEALFMLKQIDVPASGGIGCSCSSWGAPIVLRRLDIIVRNVDKRKAEKIVEGRGFRLNTTPINDFFERTVTFNEIPNLSLGDTVVHIVLIGDVGLTLFIPTMICKNKVDYNLLHSLSLKHRKVREVGAILEATNFLQKEEMVPRNVIKMFQESTKGEPTKITHEKPHRFTLMGIVPRGKHPINEMIEKKWGVNIPTFEEMRQAFDLGV